MLFNTPEFLEKEPEKHKKPQTIDLTPGEGNTLETLMRAVKWTPG